LHVLDLSSLGEFTLRVQRYADRIEYSVTMLVTALGSSQVPIWVSGFVRVTARIRLQLVLTA